MSQQSRSDVFDYLKKYRQVVQIAGRVDQDFAYSEIQNEAYFERWDVHDQMFNQGAVLAASGVILDNSTGLVQFPNPVPVYLYGRVENLPAVNLNLGAAAIPAYIYAAYSLAQVTKTQDNTLADPNTGAAIYEELQTTTVWSATTPDAFDEPFDAFVNGVPQNAVPLRTGGLWTVNSGTIATGTPAKFGRYALQLNYTNGTATTITSPSFSVSPSTTYTVYFWVKTVYGQTDLAPSDGAFVRVNTGTPFSVPFASAGGNTLLGGYTQISATFTTGLTDTTATVTISVPSTATPTNTNILFDALLITAVPLGAGVLSRHYFGIYHWDRVLSPAFIQNTYPVSVSPRQLTDFQGSLPAVSVSLSHTSSEGITIPLDISATELQLAVSQLATLRQPIDWAGTAHGIPNAYTLSPPYTTLTDGAKLRWRVPFPNDAASTLNISGLVFNTRSILRADGTQLQPGDLQQNQLVITTFDEIRNAWILPILPPGYLAGFKNLGGQINLTTPTVAYNITADLVVANNAGATAASRDVSFVGTVNLANSGPVANGRDQSGAFAANALVNIFVIMGVGVVPALIASLSTPSVGPTLPNGYEFFAYATTLVLDGSAHIISANLRGQRSYFDGSFSVDLINPPFHPANFASPPILALATSTTVVPISNITSYAPSFAPVLMLLGNIYNYAHHGTIYTSSTGQIYYLVSATNNHDGDSGLVAFEAPNIPLFYSTDAAGQLTLLLQGYTLPNGAS